MSNALMNWIHIYCIAYALVLRIHASVETVNAPDTLEQTIVDIWQGSIEPEIMKIGEVSNSDETNWRERSNFMKEFKLAKRVPNGFTGVRGKKNSLLNQMDTYSYLQNQPNEFDEVQRNNYYGLQYIYDIFRNNVDVQHTRNVNLPAFMIRSPKSAAKKLYNLNSNNIYEDEVDKRALKNAFMGVRGKKSADHSFYKRAVFNDQPEFSGRKRFEDFPNKFVAVRGKKSKNDVEPYNTTFNGQSLNMVRVRSFKNSSKMRANQDSGKTETLRHEE